MFPCLKNHFPVHFYYQIQCGTEQKVLIWITIFFKKKN